MDNKIERIKMIAKTGKCDRECDDCPISHECHHDFSKKLERHCEDWLKQHLTTAST